VLETIVDLMACLIPKDSEWNQYENHANAGN